MGRRKRKFHPPLWLRRFREMLIQIMLPLIIFQFIRTVLFPTTFDVILLAVLVVIYALLIAGIL